ncbi:restriction endonuclease subunit S [Myroides odoratimimus]|uniref:restriction endonuclease subunit S n=1 Tax=Myroides odoratimimus TaxID=76832 RepID=UPI00370B666C
MKIKIGNACEFINGGSWTESDYRGIGLPVLKVSNFNSSGFSINDISYLNFDLKNKYEKNKLELNDIIIATVGSHPSLVNSAAGRTIRVNSNVLNYYLNQNAICLRVKDSAIIDQIYLFYLTETTVFRNFIQQRGKGAANQMRIPISGIKDFSWDFPPLETQKKIAAILSGYDDLIENNLKRIKILEEMAQQTFEEWFVRMRFPGYESVAINKEIGLPEGWKKDFVSNQLGKVKSTTKIKSSEFQNEGDIPVVDQSRSFIAGFTNDESALIEYSGIPFIVFGDHTRILKLINFDFARGADGTQIVVSKNPKMPQHLFYFSLMNIDLSNYHYARHYKYLKDSEIIIPTEDIAKRFEELAQKNFYAIENLRNQNQRLREARDILLPRLMMGMIEV